MLFFYVLPFVVLAVALARLRWSAGRVDLARGLLLGMAVLFAAVGVWQWATHGVFWNDRVIEGNANAAFYRVNSLFWDPSIYGRFLVLAILVALAAVLFGRRAGTRADLAYTAAMALLWAGLVVSFSQSSFVALAAGIVVAAFVAWRWRALAAVVLAAVVMVPVGFAAPQLGEVRDNLADSSATRLTSYRSTLVGVGFDIWRDHPVAGVGLGGFNTAYVREERDPTVPAEGASHTTPVTVAAETGVVGFAFYVWLLGALVVLAFRGADLTTAMGRARVVAGICFVVIAVHSLFYSAFFEDPLMWGFAALVVVAARATPPAGATREPL
jgi:O-antigen ligase